MEIPPSSSFSQVNALFNDLSGGQRESQLMGVYPFEAPNFHLNSSDRLQASSHSGLDVEFRVKDTHEAFRILNGPLMYPFQSQAQIFNHKFDPFYYDGSELDDSFNVQENLIGTPLGASTLEDPRMSYVKNMLHMKELHGANDPFDDSYLKDLYMKNVEKGSTYYQNQLDKLDASMSTYSRTNRYKKHKPMEAIQFTSNLATGNHTHEKHTARIAYKAASDAGLIQHSRRAKRMAKVDQAIAPYSIVDENLIHRNRNRSRNTVIDIDGLSVISQQSRGTISLPDNIVDDEESIQSFPSSITSQSSIRSHYSGSGGDDNDDTSFIPFIPPAGTNVTHITATQEHNHAARASVRWAPSVEETFDYVGPAEGEDFWENALQNANRIGSTNDMEVYAREFNARNRKRSSSSSGSSMVENTSQRVQDYAAKGLSPETPQLQRTPASQRPTELDPFTGVASTIQRSTFNQPLRAVGPPTPYTMDNDLREETEFMFRQREAEIRDYPNVDLTRHSGLAVLSRQNGLGLGYAMMPIGAYNAAIARMAESNGTLRG